MTERGVGIGLAGAPATESMMGALPSDRAGIGSAVNNTTRELGGALGAAVVGTVVSSLYSYHLALPRGTPARPSSPGDTSPLALGSDRCSRTTGTSTALLFPRWRCEAPHAPMRWLVEVDAATRAPVRVPGDQLRVRITFCIVRTTNRNQFFMPGELPLVLLSMLAERSLSGYELLGELERQYAPNYRPSPGSVYPALSALRTERLVDQAPSKSKGPYRVTTKGRRMLAAQRNVLERIEARTSSAAESIASLQPSLAQFAARISKFSGRVDRAAVERILDTAAKAIADLEVTNG